MRAHVEKVGLYPGTFDPITYGHLDIVRRGLKIVDRLVLGVATNPSKTPLFTLPERCAMVERECAPLAAEADTEIKVVAFDELLMHFAQKVGANIIVRGLRAVSDFEYEFQMAGMNAHLDPDIETVFLMADVKYQPIASKLVKEIANYGGRIETFVSPQVAEDVRRKIGSKSA